MNPTDILQAFRLSSFPADVPVFAVLPKRGPVSFYSQQKRAFNLVSAMRLAGLIKPRAEVAVVGAGLAGITASAAAHMLDCSVTVFEANEAKFHQQHGNHTRYIHPNVIDWPRQGSNSPDTDLPFLNWTAGDCASVIDDIESQWAALSVPIMTSMKVKVVDFSNAGAHIFCSRPFYYRQFAAVIIACGFGEESTFGLDQKGYWSDEHWHQLMSTDGRTILVSGTGDGGLIDCMRLALLKFDHGDVLQQVMSHAPLMELSDELIAADHEARTLSGSPTTAEDKAAFANTRSAASGFLYFRYQSLGVADRVPALSLRHNYEDIILNGSLPTPFSIESSIINRVILCWLLSKGAIRYESGELQRFPRDIFRHRAILARGAKSLVTTLERIDDIIIRHGPVGALHSTLNQKASETYAGLSDQVDDIGRHEYWRSVGFQTPADFKPPVKIALSRAVRLLPSFVTWLSEIDVASKSVAVGMAPSGKHPAYIVHVDSENKKKLESHGAEFHRCQILTRVAVDGADVHQQMIDAGLVADVPKIDVAYGIHENAYSYEKCHIFSAWRVLSETAQGVRQSVRVAVIAGRPEVSHPALRDADIAEINARFLAAGENQQEADDHATAIASLLVGLCRDTGFVGVARGVGVDAFCALDSVGRGNQAEIANAIHNAVGRGVRIILLPIGAPVASEILHDAIRVAVQSGVAVVSSAGNGGGDRPVYPGAFPECITVGALDKNDRKAYFSSCGDWVDIWAPGEDIIVGRRGGRFIAQRGTSFSAAMVCGVIALMCQLDPLLTPDQIRTIFAATGDQIDIQLPEGNGHQSGKRINAYLALESVGQRSASVAQDRVDE